MQIHAGHRKEIRNRCVARTLSNHHTLGPCLESKKAESRRLRNVGHDGCFVRRAGQAAFDVFG